MMTDDEAVAQFRAGVTAYLEELYARPTIAARDRNTASRESR